MKQKCIYLLSTLLFLLGIGFTHHLSAQVTFAPPVSSPFGISTPFGTQWPALVDIDADGDLDIFYQGIISGSNAAQFHYQQNIGTANVPSYAPHVASPFGMSTFNSINSGLPTFADLDNDGDQDFLYCTDDFNNQIRYYYVQNTGTATVPSFATPVLNPFGLVVYNSSSPFLMFPTFVDIDQDGDFDIITSRYKPGGVWHEAIVQENIGTASTPLYDTAVSNPYGLVLPYGANYVNFTTADFDNDGDIDILAMAHTINGLTLNDFCYYKNIGTASAPSFGPPFLNPFGLDSISPGFGGTLADMDNDGDYDILGGNAWFSGPISYYQNNNITNGPLALSAIIYSSPTCTPGGDGSITVCATGGVGSVQYKIATDSNFTGSFTSLPAGTHTLNVKDSLGTFMDTTLVLNLAAGPTAVSNHVQNATCINNGTYSIVGVTGGTAPYTSFVLNPGNITSTYGIFNGLAPNTYTITVTDSKNCTISDVAVVSGTPLFSITTTAQNTSSPSATDGSITATVTGTTATFSIMPNVGTQSSPGIFTGLGAGTYVVTATDVSNCALTDTAIVGVNPVGLNDIKKHNISIYPNPVTDQLTIKSNEPINELTILDITGKIMRTINNPQETISMRFLPSGMYLIRLTLQNQESVYTSIAKQ